MIPPQTSKVKREPLHGGRGLVQLFLHLFAAVENGTIAAGTQNVLVQAALAPLALRPGLGKNHLQFLDVLNRFDVQLGLTRQAIGTHGSLPWGNTKKKKNNNKIKK